MKSIWKNIKLLYFIFFVSMIHIILFLYYNNSRCIILFTCVCLVTYLINKNMIFVLGVSLLLVDSLYLLNLVKKEGFEDYQDSESDENKMDTEPYTDNNELKTNLKNKKNGDTEYEDSRYNEHTDDEKDSQNSEDGEDSNYMQDKSIIEKLKKLDPVILNTLQKMNSIDIKEMNKTINKLSNAIDP